MLFFNIIAICFNKKNVSLIYKKLYPNVIISEKYFTNNVM